MTPEQLGQLLDELGKRLGPAGEHVFGLAVRQVIIEGVVSLVAGVVLVSLGVWVWRKGKAWVFSQKLDSYSDPITDRGFPMLGVGFATIAIGVPGLTLLYTALTTLTNPEYAAIRDILGRIRP